MPSIRSARGYEAVHHPYQELYEGTRPSLQSLRPSKVLPVAWLDIIHDNDPVVLLPGTFVGLLNTGTTMNGGGICNQTGTWYTTENASRALVPAHQNAYKLTYTQYDVDWGTTDIDATGSDVSAAGTSTGLIGPVKPIGVVTAPVYSAEMVDKYTNYTRDLMPSVLCGNYNVIIPAITNNEILIEPGDLVMIDNAATPVHAPTSVGSADANAAGRLMPYKNQSAVVVTGEASLTTSTGYAPALHEFIVGRCINKWVVGQDTSATDGDLLSASYTAGRTLAAVDTAHGYNQVNRVQTVPGLGLQGSDTQGIPSMFKHARCDVSGRFYALEIRVDL